MVLINNILEINKDSDKFIIYKGSGGFVHMISGLIYCIEKSIEMNRILIIDLKSNTAFGKNFSDYFVVTNDKLKYSENFDIIPKNFFEDKNSEYFSDIQKSVKNINNSYKINCMISTENNIDILDTKNIIINCGPKSFKNIKEYFFKIKESIFDKLNKENEVPNEPYISIHFRNTDKKNDLNIFIKKINETIEKTKLKTLYLATDDYKINNILKKELNNIKILQYSKPIITINNQNIHYYTKDKDKLNYETLLDMYMILNSSYFIPSINSGYSKFICLMIQNKYNIFDIKSNTIIEKI